MLAEPSAALQAQAADERRRLERDLLTPRDGRERMADIRTEMQHTMEGSAGIYRDAESLVKGVDKLHELRERLARPPSRTPAGPSTPNWSPTLELGFMLDVAETMVACALRREESRGRAPTHGLPGRDDERFLAHSMVSPDQRVLRASSTCR